MIKETLLRLKRHIIGGPETIGSLWMPEGFQCYTLEDMVRDLKQDGSGKVPKETAIPTGIYRMRLTLSKRLKIVTPEIVAVPFFTGIRIHSGNSEVDSEGCPLTGNSVAQSKDGWFLGHSRLAFSHLMAKLITLDADGHQFWIQVSIEEGSLPTGR